jgi:cyclopropane fatty-acyl-phospholipid synthase-like methyltransferase
MSDKPGGAPDFYKLRYSADLRKLQDAVFAEVYDDYFGQSSWISTADYGRFYDLLELTPQSSVLDVASGWGAPALRLARQTGCSVVGIEFDPQAVASAQALTAQLGLGEQVRFDRHDARQPMGFPDHAFDAVACFDAIAHLPDRSGTFVEWARLLKPGGRLLFTDQVLTGPISNEEVAQRSPSFYCLITVPGYNERLLEAAGFAIRHREDLTATVAELGRRHCLARRRHADSLRALEGDAAYESITQYRIVSERLARERRLSHIAFVARKTPW